jgi:hypothetical protein
VGGFRRGQQLADHTGPALVGTVELAVAVVALDVAGGGYRHVHAGVVMVSRFAVAGMGGDALLQMRGEGLAGAAAASAGRWGRGSLAGRS